MYVLVFVEVISKIRRIEKSYKVEPDMQKLLRLLMILNKLLLSNYYRFSWQLMILPP